MELEGQIMAESSYTLVYMFYGLAFFSMGLAIMLEAGRGPDVRLRHALRPLAAFGLLHGTHEWLEMLFTLELLPGQSIEPLIWVAGRIGLLAISFLSLTAFGASLLSPNERVRRLSLLAPLAQAALWGFGLLAIRTNYDVTGELWLVADVWSRYTLGVPSAIVACMGLIAQQRSFRQAGMERFGRDCLWAAVALVWYGAVGQIFTKQSPLPPSTVVNAALFQELFKIPIELVRAVAGLVAAVFVMRFLRAFEVAVERQLMELQATRLQEAERREALRGELLQRVVQAQEGERQRIARELHDETGQALTALGLGLRGISGALETSESGAAERLRRLERMVGRSLNDLQRLISDLRPSHLDDLGLPAALRWYASGLQNGLDVKVSVKILGKPRLVEAEVQTALFRVAQEAVTNVIKHADAQNATVQLHYGNETVCLVVEDDGCGFDLHSLNKPGRPSWGLLGMEERAALLGGRLVLESGPGKGTRVEVTIPYRPIREIDHED
jgi:signal transduction histidine kinase